MFLRLLLVILLFLSACSARVPMVVTEEPAAVSDSARSAPEATDDPLAAVIDQQVKKPLETLGFSIQVGAFSQLDNAVHFEALLKNRGVDAYFFLHESGFYKVRFGNYGQYDQARSAAEELQNQGLIESFFIVIPEDYAVVRIEKSGHGDLREELVRTTRRFIGVPYRWGGESEKTGFDCSGLMMVSYRLNGLDLPRNSRAQFDAGTSVKKSNLRKGDLVFFATKGGTRVTHVGMYIGDGQFIHAPRTGQTVRVASLNSTYFRRAYVGGKTYL